jgi:hypothetical protein
MVHGRGDTASFTGAAQKHPSRFAHSLGTIMPA